MYSKKMPDFEWKYDESQFSRISKQAIESLPRLYAFEIRINSDYKLGSCWTEEQAKRFKSEVYNKLKLAGFEIYQKDSSFGSEEIKGRDLYVYLHPMEFTGYGSENDINHLLEVLESCNTSIVYGFSINYKDEVYNMPDCIYEELLQYNSANILNWISEYKTTFKNVFNISFDFAESFRIPRCKENSRGGRSCFDIDIKYISIMTDVYEQLTKAGVDLTPINDYLKEEDNEKEI